MLLQPFREVVQLHRASHHHLALVNTSRIDVVQVNSMRPPILAAVNAFVAFGVVCWAHFVSAKTGLLGLKRLSYSEAWTKALHLKDQY